MVCILFLKLGSFWLLFFISQAPKRQKGNGDSNTEEYMETETGLIGRNAPHGNKSAAGGAKNAQQGAVVAAQRQNDDKPELRDDTCSVFISNLAYTLDDPETKVKEIFESCGPVIQVRLVTGNRGNFRGYGYVQFESVVSVPEALKLDRKEVGGRPMFVSPCVDKNKNPEFKVSTHALICSYLNTTQSLKFISLGRINGLFSSSPDYLTF